MDFKIVGDRLLKEYPWLKDYTEITEEHIYFSVLANNFYASSLVPLIVYGSKNKFPKLCIEGCLSSTPSSFPSRIDYSNELDKSTWDLTDSQSCYDNTYEAIIKYIPMVKAAVDWYNAIDFTHVEDTLNSLKMVHENGFKWGMHIDNIYICIMYPTVFTPCFRAIIRKQGQPYDKWVRFSEFTIDDLLSKIAEED